MQDRAEILRLGDKIVVLVADGSGGRSGAAQAAEFFIRSAREAATGLTSAQDCSQLLTGLDLQIERAADCGESTSVIAVISGAAIFGSNVGDSAVWLFRPDGKEELTRVRKPYLGTGVAAPHQFECELISGTLVVASDGLWKYTSLEAIEQKLKTADPERLAAELADLVRLRSGAFPDDVAIVTCQINT